MFSTQRLEFLNYSCGPHCSIGQSCAVLCWDSEATVRLSAKTEPPLTSPCAFNPSLSPTQGLLSSNSHCFLLQQFIIELFPSHKYAAIPPIIIKDSLPPKKTQKQTNKNSWPHILILLPPYLYIAEVLKKCCLYSLSPILLVHPLWIHFPPHPSTQTAPVKQSTQELAGASG